MLAQKSGIGVNSSRNAVCHIYRTCLPAPCWRNRLLVCEYQQPSHRTQFAVLHRNTRPKSILTNYGPTDVQCLYN